MGILPEIAHDLLPGYEANPQQVIAQAGIIISMYALGVVVGAPLFAVLGARMSQVKLACWMLAILAAGNLASAAMPDFMTVTAFRFIAGLPHGAYFGLAALIAARLLGPGSIGKAIAITMSGLTVANVFGVPLSTLLGQQLGWRWVYVLVAVLFALTLVLVFLIVPRDTGDPSRSPLRELAALKNPRVWIMVATISIGTGGFFAVYSYIAEVTTREAGLSAGIVPWVTATIGVGMVIGTLVGGWLTDRNASLTGIIGLTLSAIAYGVYATFATQPILLFVLAFVVSATASLLLPSLQSRLIRVSHEAALLGAALNHAAGNVANSLGAWVGGFVIAAGFGYLAPGWMGVLLAVIGLALLLLSLAVERRDKARSLDTAGVRVVA